MRAVRDAGEDRGAAEPGECLVDVLLRVSQVEAYPVEF